MKIVGHEKIKQRLRSVDDLPSTSLFVGPDGIGKTGFALGLLSSIHSVDITDLSETKNTIAIMRGLIDSAPRQPFASPYRIFLIDYDAVTHQASDTLLKLLEEPPDHLKIVLISSTGNVPATILSRCQVFRFEALTDEQVVEVLMRLGTHEEIARWAAKYSYGSVSEAQSLVSNDNKMNDAEAMLSALQGGQRFAFLMRIKASDDLTLAYLYRLMVDKRQTKHLRMLEANVLSKTKLLMLGLS